jgi:hypothetical protein
MEEAVLPSSSVLLMHSGHDVWRETDLGHGANSYGELMFNDYLREASGMPLSSSTTLFCPQRTNTTQALFLKV